MSIRQFLQLDYLLNIKTESVQTSDCYFFSSVQLVVRLIHHLSAALNEETCSLFVTTLALLLTRVLMKNWSKWTCVFGPPNNEWQLCYVLKHMFWDNLFMQKEGGSHWTLSRLEDMQDARVFTQHVCFQEDLSPFCAHFTSLCQKCQTHFHWRPHECYGGLLRPSCN